MAGKRGFTPRKHERLNRKRPKKENTEPEQENLDELEDQREIAEVPELSFMGKVQFLKPGTEKMYRAVADVIQNPPARLRNKNGRIPEKELKVVSGAGLIWILKNNFYKVSAYYFYPHNVSIVLTHNNSILTKYVSTFVEISG